MCGERTVESHEPGRLRAATQPVEQMVDQAPPAPLLVMKTAIFIYSRHPQEAPPGVM